jgi:tRNA(Ile)-lysidine synthase
MAGVKERVLAAIRRHRMMEPGHSVAAAVSGGADSVCLLMVLGELAAELGISLSAVHVNHCLRGAESDADEAFVRDLADHLGVVLHTERIDLPEGENLEQAARDARRRVFASLPVDRVATGHTRSDQAETVLYRLIRGSGTAGLRGILPVTAERIVRPLIDCSRADAEAYLNERGQGWRDDSTNLNREFTRNRIRHEVIPTLARDFNPAVQEVLAATAEVARDEEDFWRGELDALASRLLVRKGAAVLIRIGDLRGLHTAVVRRLLRRAAAEVKGDLRGIDMFHIEQIAGLTARTEGHGRVQAPGLDVFRSFEWLRIARPQIGSRFERDYSFDVAPGENAPVEIRLPRSRILLEIQQDANRGYNTSGDELDRRRLVGPLQLRNWHPGDEFVAPGRSRQKIKTLFQEARVPIWDRHGWPVLTCGDEIVWTRQFGTAERFLPRVQSGPVLRVYEIEN